MDTLTGRDPLATGRGRQFHRSRCGALHRALAPREASGPFVDVIRARLAPTPRGCPRGRNEGSALFHAAAARFRRPAHGFRVLSGHRFRVAAGFRRARGASSNYLEGPGLRTDEAECWGGGKMFLGGSAPNVEAEPPSTSRKSRTSIRASCYTGVRRPTEDDEFMVRVVRSLVAASILAGSLGSAGAFAQETQTKEERPKIRVLNQPGDISSFYRRGSSPHRYRFVPRATPQEETSINTPDATPALAPRLPSDSRCAWAEGSFPYPTPRHPLSSFYRSAPSFVEPIFEPPGYVPYPDRALVYRVYRPGFFLGGLAGSCFCDCGRK